MLLYLLAFASLARAADYACTTEFGETLALRKTVLRGDIRCEACQGPGAAIPLSSIDQRASGAWNEGARRAAGPSLVKRRLHAGKGRRAFLDTRYVTQSGPGFGLKISCPPEGKCKGAFANGAETLLLSTPLSDERSAGRGLAELKLGSREHLGLIVRVKKISANSAGQVPGFLSASGELKIYREDPLFIQDAGVDEALPLAPGLSARIAVFEVKIRCRRQN